MSYYRTCPDCGANLDPDERCDCWKENEETNNETEIETTEDFVLGKEEESL